MADDDQSEPDRLPWYHGDPDLAAAIAEQRTQRSATTPTPAADNRPPDGHTYIVGAEGQALVKIGRTTVTPRSRMSAMQTGSPVRLLLVASLPHTRWEDVLHHHYAPQRQQGEWFALTLDDVAAIMRWACQAAGIASEWPSDVDALAAGWDRTSSAIEGVYGARAVRAWRR